MESHLAASCSDSDGLRAANDNLLKHRSTDREELSTMRARVLKLEHELKATAAPSPDLADAARKQYC